MVEHVLAVETPFLASAKKDGKDVRAHRIPMTATLIHVTTEASVLMV